MSIIKKKIDIVLIDDLKDECGKFIKLLYLLSGLTILLSKEGENRP
ncbi:hypothetical protein [Candidatus Scalindua japonica]|nr:hypothetical protein [Candidatus Scalindua japonica]